MGKRRKEIGKVGEKVGQERDRYAAGVRRLAFVGLLFFGDNRDPLSIGRY